MCRGGAFSSKAGPPAAGENISSSLHPAALFLYRLLIRQIPLFPKLCHTFGIKYLQLLQIKGNGRIFSITGLHLIGKHLPQFVLFDESQQVLADVTGNKRLSGVQGISW